MAENNENSENCEINSDISSEKNEPETKIHSSLKPELLNYIKNNVVINKQFLKNTTHEENTVNDCENIQYSAETEISGNEKELVDNIINVVIEEVFNYVNVQMTVQESLIVQNAETNQIDSLELCSPPPLQNPLLVSSFLSDRESDEKDIPTEGVNELVNQPVNVIPENTTKYVNCENDPVIVDDIVATNDQKEKVIPTEDLNKIDQISKVTISDSTEHLNCDDDPELISISTNMPDQIIIQCNLHETIIEEEKILNEEMKDNNLLTNVGDNFNNKESPDILCECVPDSAGAAIPVLIVEEPEEICQDGGENQEQSFSSEETCSNTENGPQIKINEQVNVFKELLNFETISETKIAKENDRNINELTTDNLEENKENDNSDTLNKVIIEDNNATCFIENSTIYSSEQSDINSNVCQQIVSATNEDSLSVMPSNKVAYKEKKTVYFKPEPFYRFSLLKTENEQPMPSSKYSAMKSYSNNLRAKIKDGVNIGNTSKTSIHKIGSKVDSGLKRCSSNDRNINSSEKQILKPESLSNVKKLYNNRISSIKNMNNNTRNFSHLQTRKTAPTVEHCKQVIFEKFPPE